MLPDHADRDRISQCLTGRLAHWHSSSTCGWLRVFAFRQKSVRALGNSSDTGHLPCWRSRWHASSPSSSSVCGGAGVASGATLARPGPLPAGTPWEGRLVTGTFPLGGSISATSPSCAKTFRTQTQAGPATVPAASRARFRTSPARTAAASRTSPRASRAPAPPSVIRSRTSPARTASHPVAPASVPQRASPMRTVVLLPQMRCPAPRHQMNSSRGITVSGSQPAGRRGNLTKGQPAARRGNLTKGHPPGRRGDLPKGHPVARHGNRPKSHPASRRGNPRARPRRGNTG